MSALRRACPGHSPQHPSTYRKLGFFFSCCWFCWGLALEPCLVPFFVHARDSAGAPAVASNRQASVAASLPLIFLHPLRKATRHCELLIAGKRLATFPQPLFLLLLHFPSSLAWHQGSAFEMAQPQSSKPKLSIKSKETAVAEEPQRPAEGMPYASILKGYCGHAPSSDHFLIPRSNLRLPIHEPDTF